MKESNSILNEDIGRPIVQAEQEDIPTTVGEGATLVESDELEDHYSDDGDNDQAIELLGAKPKKQKNRKKMLVYSWSQQRTWSFSPRWRAGFIGGCLFVFSFPLFLCGILLLIMTNKQKSFRVSYGDDCTLERAHNCTLSKNITFPEALHPPIYVYYEMDQFYQNYRAYIKSVSQSQMAGYVASLSSVESSCPKMYESPNPDIPLFPCGMRSYSMFNDTISMYQNDTLFCHPSTTVGSCVAEITPYTRRVLFKYPNTSDVNYPTADYYPGEPMHKLPNITSDRYMQWMKINIGPNLRKLYRRIDQPLNGTLRLDITQHFLAIGGKSILFTEYTPFFGGYNLMLAITYFTVSGVFFVFGCILCLGVLLRHLRIRRRQVSTTELSITPRTEPLKKSNTLLH